MKHLKRFNEAAFEAGEKYSSLGKIREFEHELNNTLFTPKAEQVSLRTLYKVIVIRTQEPISTEPFQSHAAGVTKIYDTNWILLFKENKQSVLFFFFIFHVSLFIPRVFLVVLVVWRLFWAKSLNRHIPNVGVSFCRFYFTCSNI